MLKVLIVQENEDSDERGVTPVLGSILLITITIIISGATATVIMNQQPQEPKPEATLTTKIDDKIILTHEGGQPIKNAPKSIKIKINNKKIDLTKNNITSGNNNTDLEIGERIIINANYSKGDTLAIAHEPSKTVLQRKTFQTNSPPNNQPPKLTLTHTPTNPTTTETITF